MEPPQSCDSSEPSVYAACCNTGWVNARNGDAGFKASGDDIQTSAVQISICDDEGAMLERLYIPILVQYRHAERSNLRVKAQRLKPFEQREVLYSHLDGVRLRYLLGQIATLRY